MEVIMINFTVLKYTETVAPAGYEPVHGDSVDFLQPHGLAIDADSVGQHPLEWFPWAVPSELNSREGGVPAWQIGVHGHTVL